MRRALWVMFAFVLLSSVPLFAQTADQEVVSVVDAPDPVIPGQNLTYTVTLRNNGPDPATGGGLNMNLPGEVTYVGTTAPAGFSCVGFGGSATCNMPSLPVGTYVLTVTVNVASHLVNFPDGSFNANFFPSGTTIDPNNGNNAKSATTSWDSPQIDIAISATDSPDPISPDADLTYTIDVSNNGPNTATNVNFNTVHMNGMTFQSVTAPSPFTCPTLPPVGGTPTFTCTAASFAPGTVQFIVVMRVDDANLGIRDGELLTHFDANGQGDDTNDGNSSQDVTTDYETPDADLSIMATDSPDPVGPDGDITYVVTITNSGPDPATTTNFNVPMNNTLRFRSINIPAGFNCPNLPAVDAGTSFTCTNPSMAAGTNAVFTVVLRAAQAAFGNFDQTIVQNFNATSAVFDPDPAVAQDNSVDVSTQYDVSNANLGITATDSPDPVQAGNNITYTGNVTNAGPDTATTVTATMLLDPALLFVSLSPPAGFSCTTPSIGATGTITCTIATLANGANLPFSLVAQVNPSLLSGPDGIVQPEFVIGSNTNDPTLPNNELTVTTSYTTPDADLSVTNADTPDPVATGGTITYTQTITNNGPDTATSATFQQSVPVGTTFQSFAPVAGWTCPTPAIGGTGAINCTKASMASGETATFTLVVNVTATSGTISSTVTGDSNTYDPDPLDNSATAVTSLPPQANADLAITKTTTATSAAVGSTFSYTITVTNNGPDAAANVVMTDTLPATLLFQSITQPSPFTCVTPAVDATGTITCTAASLASGQSRTFTLVVEVAPGATGSIVNSAAVDSDANDQNGGNSGGSAPGVTATPAASADLGITKTTTATSQPAGTSYSYTITVTNAGPDAATNVVMTDILPASLLFQSITQPSPFTCTTPAVGATGTITCTAATLASGTTRTFTLVVRVATNASGPIVNSASVTSSTADPDGTDGSDDAPTVTATAASADLGITKTTNVTAAPTGSTITYTITVTNAGPSPATNVTVTDDLPASLQFISATPSQGTCNAVDPVVCNLGTLNSGANATIALQALVVATSGTIANTATVDSPTGDPNGGNDSTTTPPIPVSAAQVEAIPTLSEWGLIAAAMLLGLAALMRMKS